MKSKHIFRGKLGPYARRRAGKKSFSNNGYESLEPRQLLATTLYVDFGIGTGDFTINNTQTASANGPVVFGDGTLLESFTSIVESSQLDLNFDDQLSGADTTAFIDQVMINLNEIFEVFDVSIRQVDSTDFAGMTAKLAEQATNDAYIFVGGRVPHQGPPDATDAGASLFDAGNTDDNLGFFFASDVFEHWLDKPFFYPQNYNVAPQLSWAFARGIAKQAAHSFGVNFTEGSVSSTITDVMRRVGTDVNGHILIDGIGKEYTGEIGVFTRADLPGIIEFGQSTGTKNSYEALVAAVGLKPDAPYYITGKRTGSTEAITVVVNDATDSLTINVGTTTFEPTLAELEHGLLINGASQATLTIGQLPDFEFQFKNLDHLQVDPELDMDTGLSFLPRNVWRSHLRALPVIGAQYFGSVNDNMTFHNIESIEGGDGDDVFNMTATQKEVGADLDRDFFLNFFAAARDVAIGNGQNDIFTMDRTVGRVTGGAGYDYFGGIAFELDGGEDFDVQEYGDERQLIYLDIVSVEPGATGQPGHFAFRNNSSNGQFKRDNLERIVIRPVQDDATVLLRDIENDAPLTVITWNNQTIVHDKSTAARVEIVGLNEFFDENQHDLFYVRGTTHDLKFVRPGFVQISSEFDPRSGGHVDWINHRITLAGHGPTSKTSQLVIGDRAGDGVLALVTKDWLGGVTGNTIAFADGFFPAVTIYGSDTDSDYVTIASTHRNITVRGNGGDDFFVVGYEFGGEALIDRIEGEVTLDGGAGNDLVQLEDVGGSKLKIYNRYVSKESVPDRDDPTFGGLRYDQFENFRAKVNWYHMTEASFYSSTIWASTYTRYQLEITMVQYNQPRPRTDEMMMVLGNQNDGRVFMASSTPPEETGEDPGPGFVPDAFRGGVWKFPGARFPIFITRINHTVPGS